MIDDLSAMVKRKVLLLGAGVAICAVAAVVLIAVCRDPRPAPRSPPDGGGPRGRQCIAVGPPALPPGAAVESRHLHWSAVLSDDTTGATLGVIAVDATYAVGPTDSHGRRACVETLGVPRDLAVVPVLTGASFARPGEPARWQLTLDVAIRGPARREHGRALSSPEAGVVWRLDVGASRVAVARDPATAQPRLRPAWDDVVLAIRDGAVAVEVIAAR